MTRNHHKSIFKMKNKKAGSYTTNYQLVKRIAIIALSYAAIGTIGLLTLNNCKKKDPDINHEVNIDGNVPGANYKAWKNGRIIDTGIGDSQGDIRLSFTNKEENTLLDSITAQANGYNRFLVKNVQVGTSTKYLTINLSRTLFDYWLSGQRNNVESVKAYKDGRAIMQ